MKYFEFGKRRKEYDIRTTREDIMIRYPLLNRRHIKRRTGSRYLISRRSKMTGHGAVIGCR